MKPSTQLLVRMTVRYCFLCVVLVAFMLIASPVYGAETDYVKQNIEGLLQKFQGQLGDWIVLGSLVCAGISLLRKSFRTSVGFLIIVAGVVVLRITISMFFG